MMSRSHQEAVGMIFDYLGWSLMIFKHHDFFDDFIDIYHIHHLEESASHPSLLF